MNRQGKIRSRSLRQAGSVAVEVALALTAMAFVFTFLFEIGRALLVYNAGRNAAYAATRYVALGTPAELADGSRVDAGRALFRSLAGDSSATTDARLTVGCVPYLDCGSPVTAVSAVYRFRVGGDGSGVIVPFDVPVTATTAYQQ